MYSKAIHKPMLACEKRRERHLPLVDYREREKEPLVLQREGLL
jgi:hypothetical protein